MEPSSSSKVTVEYFDPSGLFPSVAPELLPRLPLRNLNWKSPTRPIRSIDSLHVDLVPHGQPESFDRNSGSHRPSTTGSNNSGESGSQHGISDVGPVEQKTIPEAGHGTLKGPLKERRHQIPGLRQTPYLKLYILRCDDNESYKNTARKQLREWVKEHTPRTQSSSKTDNHDAFEWLIVHAVLPGTTAAAQSRTFSSGNDPTSAGNAQEKSTRWPSRNTSTVLEKIRSDFNSSSKNAPDRVVQVRLLTLVTPTNPFPLSPVTTAEKEGDWADLVTRLKVLILRSFDSRVSQYEDDIREREQQRALPGWNFCTFFILKEGLARGFESVGLLEDARVSYDELAVGLDSIVRDQFVPASSEPQAGTFLPYTENLRRDLEEAFQNVQNAGDEESREVDTHADQLAINTNQNRYRNLILSNNISIFDFRCYIFARQLSILLRMANGIIRSSIPQERRMSNAKDAPTSGENLAVLASICERSVEFISGASRTLRKDLEEGYLASHPKEPDSEEGDSSERDTFSALIDNIVSSWIYSSCQQILRETHTKALPIPLFRGEGQRTSSLKEATFASHKHEQKLSLTDQKVLGERRLTGASEPPSSRSSIALSPDAQNSSFATRPVETQREQFLKTGLESLAAARATLYVLARSALSQSVAFKEAFTDAKESDSGNLVFNGGLEDISLDPSDRQIRRKSAAKHVGIAGIADRQLRQALSSSKHVVQFYEDLSERALRHYVVADRQVAAQRLSSDIAILKYTLKDYEAASTYFQRVITFYLHNGWTQIDAPMLQAHAHCLKEVGDFEGYVQVIKRLLADAVNQIKIAPHISQDSIDDTQVQYWHDLLKYGENGTQELNFEMSHYFGDILVDPVISHVEGQDGFSMNLYVKNVLSGPFKAESLRLHLISTDSDLGEKIVLQSVTKPEIAHGRTKIVVQSNAVISGSYRTERVELRLPRLTFYHECGEIDLYSADQKSRPINLMKSTNTVTVYPRAESVNLQIEWAKAIHFAQSRSILIHVNTGDNHISEGQLRLKCGSAGLRLHMPELTSDLAKRKAARPGYFEFSDAQPHQRLDIVVPYTTERDVADIQIKLEFGFKTSRGSFLIKDQATIPVVLPLGVNVRDAFRKNTLFSTFNVSSATSVPIRLFSSTLRSSEDFQIRSGHCSDSEMLVFPNQSASLVYEIRPLESKLAQDQKPASSLELQLEYCCLDDELVGIFQSKFTSSLQHSSFKDLNLLLIRPLKTWFSSKLGTQKLERYGLTGDFLLEKPKLEEILGIAAVISPPRFKELDVWIEDWFKSHRNLKILESSPPNLANAQKRRITIPVVVPSVPVVHTVDIQFSTSTPNTSGFRVVAVGQMLEGRIRIESTRKWDIESHNKDYPWPLPAGESGPEAEFILDVQANGDSWLIGGSKKRHFTAREGEVQDFPIMLMALQAGHLLLPNIDIHPVPIKTSEENEEQGHEHDHDDADQPKPNQDQLQVTCEVDYLGHGEVVLAVPARTSATVGIASGTGGATSHSSAWLMDSTLGSIGTSG